MIPINYTKSETVVFILRTPLVPKFVNLGKISGNQISLNVTSEIVEYDTKLKIDTSQMVMVVLSQSLTFMVIFTECILCI